MEKAGNTELFTIGSNSLYHTTGRASIDNCQFRPKTKKKFTFILQEKMKTAGSALLCRIIQRYAQGYADCFFDHKHAFSKKSEQVVKISCNYEKNMVTLTHNPSFVFKFIVFRSCIIFATKHPIWVLFFVFKYERKNIRYLCCLTDQRRLRQGTFFATNPAKKNVSGKKGSSRCVRGTQ